MARMKTQISVTVSAPPIVEIDTESRSAYVRFSNKDVMRTQRVASPQGGPVVTIDWDRSGKIVGVELIGVDHFNINELVLKASLRIDASALKSARYVAASRAG